jgi:predicted thioredoxin/glutaredoxin
MLIEWRGELAERLAIGVIRHDVWMSIAERRKEYIRLG